MEELIKQGKIRHPGTSNYSGWQVCEMLWIAKNQGYTPLYVSQPHVQPAGTGNRARISAMAKKYDVATLPQIVYLCGPRGWTNSNKMAVCAEGPLPPEVLRICDDVWAERRDPVPVYNR